GRCAISARNSGWSIRSSAGPGRCRSRRDALPSASRMRSRSHRRRDDQHTNIRTRPLARTQEDLMHVGYGAVFQNPNNQMSDRDVWKNELRLAEMAEPLGFESVWCVEHHFDDYTMCPDVVQFLTSMAGRTRKAKLGSGVVVLPWHDPIRVAEQISMLDHVSDGRMIFGMGRGLARIEYDGFRIDQNEA